MAKALKLFLSTQSSIFSGKSVKLCSVSKLQPSSVNQSFLKVFGNNAAHTPRAHCTLSAAITQMQRKSHICQTVQKKIPLPSFSTEVDKEISKFLDKEIQYEKSRSRGNVPTIPGFDISTSDADVTLTKSSGSEKVTVKLTVNGAVDSVVPDGQGEEPPQMVCRPPFEVEINKGGTVLALQCTFPSVDDIIEETGQQAAEQIEDQFEIQEVAIHGGEWKNATYSVSAATMDAELFDLLMDMLDEKGINDEFIAHLVDYCTAYENQKYVGFLSSLKSFSEK